MTHGARLLLALGSRIRLMGTGALVVVVGACGTVTPDPLTEAELQNIAAGRLANYVQADQEPVSGSINLYEAMARAIKYNLDRQVELKQEALRSRELRLSEFDMLPNLIARAEYTSRDNDPGGRSIALPNGADPGGLGSRSTERDVTTGDLTLSWDILDFGISYIRSQQRGDDVLIALEQRRAATNRIIEDVRTSYWRAVSAQRLLARIEQIKSEGERALNQSSGLINSGEADRTEQLTFQRDILEDLQDVEAIKRDLRVAKRQLAALMNLPIGQDFHVVLPKRGRHNSHLPMDPEKMIRQAMLNRPELREVTYRQRKNKREDQVATLEVLPNLELFLGAEFSTNDLLANDDWVTTGARSTWNLLRVARLPERRRTIEAGGKLLDARALALTQAVATQVLVSRERFKSIHQEYHTAERVLAAQRRLTAQVDREFNAGAVSQQQRVRERYRLLLAELRADVAFADMQNAFANLYASMGLDSYDAQLTGDESVDQMSRVLKKWWRKRGDRSAG
ncbi:TolC family protein [Actibacterium sp. 188UL27-1]|uniref:TolC family protein n=1 Tax=Actibacterium sp. 188UL27-1 TaxID=2786961 RepID=UPI00195D150A|nr:TolC family protein [Actibacterium sp. 188UL27-1]MBM7069285.1 TolC family protein [Actibacterium sp. 188UL27-1]